MGKKNGKTKVNFFYNLIIEKITCPYHFGYDTIDGLVSELSSVIVLNDEDYDIIKKKLTDCIINHQKKISSSFSSTNSTYESQQKQKSKLEEFLNNYDLLFNQINNLNKSNCSNNLEYFCKKIEGCCFMENFGKELILKLDEYKNKKKNLLNIIK